MSDTFDNAAAPDASKNVNEEWLLIAQGAEGYFQKVELSTSRKAILVTAEDNSKKEIPFTLWDVSYDHLRKLAENPNTTVKNEDLSDGCETSDAVRNRMNRIVESLEKKIPAGKNYWKAHFENKQGQKLIVDGLQKPDEAVARQNDDLSQEGSASTSDSVPAPASALVAGGGFTLALLHDALVGGNRFSTWARLESWDALAPFPDDAALDESSFLQRLLSPECLAELDGRDGFSLEALMLGECGRDALRACYNVFANGYFRERALGSARRLACDLGLADGALQGLADSVFDAAGAQHLAEPFFRCALQDPGKGLLLLAFFALFGADGAARLANLLAPMR